MLSFFGRLTAFVTGLAYLVFGYCDVFPNAPMAPILRVLFASGIPYALLFMVTALGGYTSANFFGRLPGVVPKLVAGFAMLPLVVSLLYALSGNFSGSEMNQQVLSVAYGSFLASSLVLLVCAFLVRGSVPAKADSEHH